MINHNHFSQLKIPRNLALLLAILIPSQRPNKSFVDKATTVYHEQVYRTQYNTEQ